MAVPVERCQDFDEARGFARGLSELLAHRHPDRFTVALRKMERGGRLSLDFMRKAATPLGGARNGLERLRREEIGRTSPRSA